MESRAVEESSGATEGARIGPLRGVMDRAMYEATHGACPRICFGTKGKEVRRVQTGQW
jgi:hypothetical protein